MCDFYNYGRAGEVFKVIYGVYPDDYCWKIKEERKIDVHTAYEDMEKKLEKIADNLNNHDGFFDIGDIEEDNIVLPFQI